MTSRLTYTVPEIAELLGVSRSTAYECVRTGEIPSLTLGRRVLVPKSFIDELLGTGVDGVRPAVRCTRSPRARLVGPSAPRRGTAFLADRHNRPSR